VEVERFRFIECKTVWGKNQGGISGQILVGIQLTNKRTMVEENNQFVETTVREIRRDARLSAWCEPSIIERLFIS